MNPVILGLIIFACIFILFVMRCYHEAKQRNKQDKDQDAVVRNFWRDVEFNDEYKVSERPYVGDKL